MTQIGFIGMGNMARAIVQGWLLQKTVRPENLLAYAPDAEKLRLFAEETGIVPFSSLSEMVQKADFLIVAVKPEKIEPVLSPLKADLKDKALISVAAGWEFDRYNTFLGPSLRHLSILPNTPVSVGEGVILFEEKHSLTTAEFAEAERLFSAIGTVEQLPSALMGIGSVVSGCSPAFFNLILEAVADGGVLHGLPRDVSYRLAAQALAGTGKMQLATALHPGILKDGVCSPGGTTIRGVSSLEKDGVRGAFIRAVDAAARTEKPE